MFSDFIDVVRNSMIGKDSGEIRIQVLYINYSIYHQVFESGP
jgi:hypothetical protein